MASVLEGLQRRLELWNGKYHYPITDARFCVIDTELTGLDRNQDAIIALSAIRMSGARILIGETFYSLVNPERALARDNVLVHRLRGDDLADQPTIQNALEKFAEFIGDDVIVGHFVQIDLGFLKRDFQRHLGRALNNRWVDTQRAHQWAFLQEQQFLGGYGMQSIENTEANLFELARRYNIRVHGAHHALYDAFLAAQVWQRVIVTLRDLGVRRLRDALRVAGG
ncbi:MAG: 3'-5' exonuclease [Chloroflexi bacterium]|nr:3'-5' exonuclease [Chloroflexota bacterium]